MKCVTEHIKSSSQQRKALDVTSLSTTGLTHSMKMSKQKANDFHVSSLGKSLQDKSLERRKYRKMEVRRQRKSRQFQVTLHPDFIIQKQSTTSLVWKLILMPWTLGKIGSLEYVRFIDPLDTEAAVNRFCYELNVKLKSKSSLMAERRSKVKEAEDSIYAMIEKYEISPFSINRYHNGFYVTDGK